MTPEGKVKLAVRNVLTKLEAYWFCPVQTGMGARTLDFLVCYRGKFFGIETKKEGGQPTKLQEVCMRKIQASGGECVVIDSVDKADFLEHWMRTHAE